MTLQLADFPFIESYKIAALCQAEGLHLQTKDMKNAMAFERNRGTGQIHTNRVSKGLPGCMKVAQLW